MTMLGNHDCFGWPSSQIIAQGKYAVNPSVWLAHLATLVLYVLSLTAFIKKTTDTMAGRVCTQPDLDGYIGLSVIKILR
jgi:hypothetical protein